LQFQIFSIQLVELCFKIIQLFVVGWSEYHFYNFSWHHETWTCVQSSVSPLSEGNRISAPSYSW